MEKNTKERPMFRTGTTSNQLHDLGTQEMRFLVTQDCNYGCVFCHREGLQSEKSDLMTPEDYRTLFRVGKQYFNMGTATLTGGEPLFRRDVVQIAKNIYDEGGVVTLTTNGFLLSQRVGVGEFLNKINLSLHSLDQDKYEGVVNRKGVFEKVKAGLLRFRDRYPQIKLVLNATLIEGFNFDTEDLVKFIQFAQQIEASIKFIELFPPKADGYVSLEQAKDKITALGFHEDVASPRKINLTNGLITISLTRILCAQAMESDNAGQYCNQVNDLFISPDARIKPCRENISEIDMLDDIKLQNRDQIIAKIQLGLDLLGQECKY